MTCHGNRPGMNLSCQYNEWSHRAVEFSSAKNNLQVNLYGAKKSVYLYNVQFLPQSTVQNFMFAMQKWKRHWDVHLHLQHNPFRDLQWIDLLLKTTNFPESTSCGCVGCSCCLREFLPFISPLYWRNNFDRELHPSGHFSPHPLLSHWKCTYPGT